MCIPPPPTSTWRRRAVSDPNPTCARPDTENQSSICSPTPKRFCMPALVAQRESETATRSRRQGREWKATSAAKKRGRFTTLSSNQYPPPPHRRRPAGVSVSPPHSDSSVGTACTRVAPPVVVAYAALLIWKSRPPVTSRGIDAAGRLHTCTACSSLSGYRSMEGYISIWPEYMLIDRPLYFGVLDRCISIYPSHYVCLSTMRCDAICSIAASQSVHG